eukprot:7519576-Lingulodinium_polyedra.AAC.1
MPDGMGPHRACCDRRRGVDQRGSLQAVACIPAGEGVCAQLQHVGDPLCRASGKSRGADGSVRA